jgi:predicted outer membrane lipoprotein
VNLANCDRDRLLGVTGGLTLAAGVGIIALLWLRHARAHNPIAEANRIIQSLNDKIGELEGQVRSLQPSR